MVRLTPRALRPAALTGLALSLLAVGCSSQGAADRRPDGPEVRPWSGAAHFSADETTRLHDTVQRAVAECMDDRGFTYRLQPARSDRRAAETSPYGLLSAAVSRADGYGVVGGLLSGGEAAPSDANAAAVAGLGEEQGKRWREALLGREKDMREVLVPDGPTLRYSPSSCEVRGREEVYGKGWDVVLFTVETAANGVVEAVEEDAGYRASLRDWSACMAERGHDFPDLRAPRAEFAARAERAKSPAELRALGEEEIETASRDHACERNVRLHEATAEAQKRVEREELRRTPELAEQLDRIRDMKRTALRTARASTSSGPG
ncbi:hypothetical protein [Streptomyces sp. NPDC006267]|uniref:hypothetical protein n=1 Tax=Streptomyces sp. NPDC006267 TaxID=3157173 RepID=UPI0033A0EB55